MQTFYYLILFLSWNHKKKSYENYQKLPNKSAAYKHADGKKIDGKRVLVDVERARTVKGWLPRRLGGGLGGTRRGGPEVNIKHSGREDNVREKERYRLEREREDRRGTEDRRGDSKLNWWPSYWHNNNNNILFA